MLQQIGKYEVLDLIASGGQGSVYRVRDTVLDRIVAVKVINQPVAADPQYLEALQREARLAAGLDHPNITTVFDFQVDRDRAYIVMEYVPGALERHLQRGTRLPWERAAEIATHARFGLPDSQVQGLLSFQTQAGCLRRGAGGEIIFVSHALGSMESHDQKRELC